MGLSGQQLAILESETHCPLGTLQTPQLCKQPREGHPPKSRDGRRSSECRGKKASLGQTPCLLLSGLRAEGAPMGLVPRGAACTHCHLAWPPQCSQNQEILPRNLGLQVLVEQHMDQRGCTPRGLTVSAHLCFPHLVSCMHRLDVCTTIQP